MNAGPVYITHLASFLPNAAVPNDDMERVLGQIGPRPSRVRRTILRNNGITARHYAIDPDTLAYTHTNAGLTGEAVRRLGRDGAAPAPADCLAAGTTIADQLAPSHGLMVHGELAWPPCEVVSTSGICLSGMSAFKYACMGVATGEHRHAVATGSELVSPLLRAENFDSEAQQQLEAVEGRPELAFDKDFLRWMLSDGAGAALLVPEPGPGPGRRRGAGGEGVAAAGPRETGGGGGAVKQDDGSLRGWPLMDQQERAETSAMAIKQDVRLLNEHVMDYTVYHALVRLRDKHSLQPNDFDWFLPHYSSQYFRGQVHDCMRRAGMAIPDERWFTNLATRGNTGSASIYIMLAELFHSGRLERGQRILCYIPESGRFSTAFMALTVT
jgi:3-oxoacyl-[acyl-carrier-protein] synthase-3